MKSSESMEAKFIFTVKSACVFKNHRFYVESVALIFKLKVQSQVVMNKDKMDLLFF